MNATTWDLGSMGWEGLTNETNITIVKSSVHAWQQAGNGIAGVIVFSALIILAVFIVMARTKNPTIAGFVGILIGMVVSYYRLLDFSSVGHTAWNASIIIYPIYIVLAVGIGMALAKIFLKD